MADRYCPLRPPNRAKLITGRSLTIEGRCAIADQKTQLEVTCQTGRQDCRKHFRTVHTDGRSVDKDGR